MEPNYEEKGQYSGDMSHMTTCFTYFRRGLRADDDHSLNRIGNLLVPNSNYCAFEDWVVPILDQMVTEQEGSSKTKWSPSTVIRRLGKEIDNEDSVYYWCSKVRLNYLLT